MFDRFKLRARLVVYTVSAVLKRYIDIRESWEELGILCILVKMEIVDVWCHFA